MISNEEYELSKPLASALKGKAPFVGLPIPGHAPLIFKREFLQRALKGVKPVYIGVETVEGSTARALVIEGVAGSRVRTKYRLFPIDRNRLLGRGIHWNDPIAKGYRRYLQETSISYTNS